MKKKFICPICGYVHEGEEAPARCPQCKQIVEWKVVDESAALNFVTAKATPKSPRPSSAMPSKRPTTAPDSPNCWATWFGTPRPTSTSA